MKLSGKLDEKNEALLHRTTGTIVTQVDAMKQMVNDFRDFAKLPEAVLKPLNLKFFSRKSSTSTTAPAPKWNCTAKEICPKSVGMPISCVRFSTTSSATQSKRFGRKQPQSVHLSVGEPTNAKRHRDRRARHAQR